jgi:WD40 repeat protein
MRMQRRTNRLAALALVAVVSAWPVWGKVRIVSAPAARRVAPFGAPAASPHVLKLEKVGQASFSPDGRVLMTVSEVDHQVHFWDAQTGEEVNRFGVAVRYAVFSGSGNRVLTWDEEKLIRIFDARTGKALRRIEGAGDALAAAAISDDGTRVLTCATGATTLKLWDATTGRLIGDVQGADSPVTILAFSPDAARALSTAAPAAGTAGKPSVCFWDLEGRKVLQKVELPWPALSASFSASGKLALVQTSNAVKVYDVATGKEVAAPPAEEKFPAGQVKGDGRTGVLKGLGTAVVTDLAKKEVVRPLDGPLDGLPICNAFSADGARVVLGTGKAGFFSGNPDLPGSVFVHDVKTGKQIATFKGHARQVTQVGISPDGQRVFSRDSDETLFLWAVGK